jgi:hypothetical protein
VTSSPHRWNQAPPQTSQTKTPFCCHQNPWILTSTILLLASLTCGQTRAQDGPSVSPRPNTIRGVVMNSVTREPVGRALVYSPDNRFGTIADEQGHFEFTLPQPTTDPNATSGETSTFFRGAVQVEPSIPNFPGVLMARKPGFLSSENRSWMSNQALVTKGKDLIVITLVPEALIIGRVVLSTSNASDRIEVELYRRQVQEGRVHWIKAGSERTRANGDFRFAELEAGTYKLLTREMMDRDPLTFDPQAQLYGYPPVYFPNATDFATASPIQLTPGVPFQVELSPLRRPYYPVKLAVTNAPPDAQLDINVSVQGRKGPGYSLGYNDRDQRIEGLLPNGTYVVEASSEGLSAATGSVTITVKGGALEGPAITLVPHGSVRVNAKLEFKPDPDSDQSDGRSQSALRNGQWRRQNLNLRVEPAGEFAQGNSPQLRPPKTTNDDFLVFDNVAPGRYWVRVDASRGFAASIRSGEIDLLRQPLTVGLGSSPVVDVTMRDDGAEIVGAIEGLAGNSGGPGDAPVSGSGSFIVDFSSSGVPAFVYCLPLPDSTGQFRQAWVSPDGKFSLQQVPPGAYRVLAFDHQQPELEYRNSEAMRAYDAKGQVVRLVAGQKEYLRLQLISTGE